MPFIPFVRDPRRPQPTKQARIVAIVAIVAATLAATAGVVSNLFMVRKPGAHAADPSTYVMIVGAALAVVLVVLVLVAKNIQADIGGAGEDGARSDGTASSSSEDDDRRPFVLLAAAIAVVAVIVIAFFAIPRAAHAQGTEERGTLYVVRGADTVVTDRFAWNGDTLSGRVLIKGGTRIEYVTVTGPANTVRTFAFDVYTPAQKAGDKPASHASFTMQDDTAIVRTAAGATRIGTKVGAIPMIGNLIAMTELFTRRARAAGGTLDIPYLAAANGATLTATLKPAGADSLVMALGPQEQRFRVDAKGRILGGAVPAAGLEFVRGAADASAPPVKLYGAPAPPPDYSAPPGAPYTAEDVRVPGPGGIVLGGTLTKPKNSAGRLPAVVTITGSGQQDRDEFIPVAGGVRLFRQLADTLGRRGIAVLRLDDRGLGASGGDARSATTADFADDIRSAIAYLRARPDIDPARIALAGHSEGAIIAPMIAATDHSVRAIVLFAGTAVPGIEISMGQNKDAVDRQNNLSPSQRDSILAAARIALAPEKQTVPWLKYFLAYDPTPALRKVQAATLVIQGETDRQVPPAQATLIEKLIKSGGNKDVTVRLFPATDHLLVPDVSGDPSKYDSLKVNKVRPEVLGAVADWLVLKLGASPVVK